MSGYTPSLERLIEQFAKAILKNEPNLQERIDEILAGKIDPMGK